MTMNIQELVNENFDLVVEYRRHIHENPELSGVEFETLKYIKAHLERVGIPYQEIPNGGILGFIEGGKPGRTVLLRGDMDALPVQEPERNLKNVRVCRSKNDGVMHACGHDAHTSMLMVAGKILWENRAELTGNVILCFERGEEASDCIEWIVRYLMDNKVHYDAAFGIHVDYRIPCGKISLVRGAEEAGVLPIDIKVIGKGGHGSRPDLCNNPLDCMLQIMAALKDVRMKYIDPCEQLTVGINVFSAGTRFNVIPDEGILAGSVRYFSTKKVAEPFKKIMHKICKAAAEQFDCQVILDSDKSRTAVLPVYNDEALALLGQEAFRKHIDPDVVEDAGMQFTSESFSFYGILAPIAYATLGVTNPEYGSGADLHNQYFDLDEESLRYGVMAYVSFAYEYLKADEVKTSWEAPSQEMIDSCIKPK